MLRCDIVHAGCVDIYADGKGLYLTLNNDTLACTICTTDFMKYRIIDIYQLCDTIFDCVASWCKSAGTLNFKYTRVFDGSNHDDVLLYRKLCDEDRAEQLKLQFDKENKV